MNKVYAAIASALLLIGVAFTCAAQAPVLYPPRTPVLFVTPFVPPPQYRVWYHDMEVCTGLAGNFDQVRWGYVPHPWPDGKGGWTLALWHRGQIIVSGDFATDSTVISHEAVHDLLSRHNLQSDDDPHPTAYFRNDGSACAKASWP